MEHPPLEDSLRWSATAVVEIAWPQDAGTRKLSAGTVARKATSLGLENKLSVGSLNQENLPI